MKKGAGAEGPGSLQEDRLSPAYKGRLLQAGRLFLAWLARSGIAGEQLWVPAGSVDCRAERDQPPVSPGATGLGARTVLAEHGTAAVSAVSPYAASAFASATGAARATLTARS